MMGLQLLGAVLGLLQEMPVRCRCLLMMMIYFTSFHFALCLCALVFLLLVDQRAQGRRSGDELGLMPADPLCFGWGGQVILAEKRGFCCDDN